MWILVWFCSWLMKLIILVGTMTSTADYVAQAIKMDCSDLVDDIEVQLTSAWMDVDKVDFQHEPFDCAVLLGDGEFPDELNLSYELQVVFGSALVAELTKTSAVRRAATSDMAVSRTGDRATNISKLPFVRTRPPGPDQYIAGSVPN